MAMETFSIQFDFRALKAAALCASSEETRFYLKGVFVECGESGFTLVATDGHRLIAIRPQYNAPMPNGPEFGIIIPLHIVARIKLNRFADMGDLVCEAGQWRLEYDGIIIGFKPVDGAFPEWRRIVPAKCNGATAQFNAKYLSDFAKASKIMGGDTLPTVSHNGDSPALIGFQSEIEALGVLMPFRASIVPTVAPQWALPAKSESKAA